MNVDPYREPIFIKNNNLFFSSLKETRCGGTGGGSSRVWEGKVQIVIG
jgi:hypothetical protein